jgi:hypothetical protein
MKIEQQIFYVAFLDILGFKSMVESESNGGEGIYLNKLFKCHKEAKTLFDANTLTTVQFSDSIVISEPYKAKAFSRFITSIAKYQRMLLDEGLLCRGGIAVNRHFSNGAFTFSAGLIDAYKVESETARFPRVVISPNVIDLVFPTREISSELILEDDGQYFIDYLGITKDVNPKQLTTTIEKIVTDLRRSTNSSVREKGIWLSRYSDAVLGSHFTQAKFSFTTKARGI